MNEEKKWFDMLDMIKMLGNVIFGFVKSMKEIMVNESIDVIF